MEHGGSSNERKRPRLAAPTDPDKRKEGMIVAKEKVLDALCVV